MLLIWLLGHWFTKMNLIQAITSNEECIITAAVGEIEGSANLKVVEKISTAKLTGGLRIGVSIRA